jgi:hypothetical protein
VKLYDCERQHVMRVAGAALRQTSASPSSRAAGSDKDFDDRCQSLAAHPPLVTNIAAEAQLSYVIMLL